MKFFLISLSLLMTMQKCSNKAEVIDSKNIMGMTIAIDSTSENPIPKEIKINQRDSLISIVTELNDCSKQPIKFYPTHRIKLVYNTGKEEMIFCSGSSMKYQGLTYKMDKKIKDIIGQ